MKKHQYFNLNVHTDCEIEQILSCKIMNREIIHEWPLSTVHKIETDNLTYIYKSEFGPTVEIDFLENNKSKYLPKIVKTIKNSEHKISIREFIHGQTLDLYKYSETELHNIRTILFENTKIFNTHNVYLDFSSFDKLNRKVIETLASLEFLKNNNVFTKINNYELIELERLLSLDDFYKASIDNISLVHGDLYGENIIINNQNMKIIDWQRPLLTNQLIDKIRFNSSFNIHNDEDINKWCFILNEFIHITWAVECKLKWFPESTDYENWVIESMKRILTTAST